MELTEAQVQERLNDPNNVVNIIRKRRTGNGDYSRANRSIPDEIKTLVAMNDEDGTREIGRALDISHKAVSSIQRGLNPRGDAMDEGLNNLRKERQDKIRDKAEENLLELIQAVKPKIAEEGKLKNLTSAAKDMASVAEKILGPKLGSGAQVIIYAPVISKGDRYSSIAVNVQE